MNFCYLDNIVVDSKHPNTRLRIKVDGDTILFVLMEDFQVTYKREYFIRDLLAQTSLQDKLDQLGKKVDTVLAYLNR